MAIESGSRAWGFASPDSDYDVRFIYVRKEADYLKLEKTRDVIEWKLDDVLNINGWDIKKALQLFADIREEYSRYVLRDKKSQLLKTNGFGAIIKLFPKVYNVCGKEAKFIEYMQVIKRLDGKVDWCADEVLTSGTGAKIINKVYEKLEGIILSQV